MAVITTVIPTYRRPKRLERAVRSVLAQTYDDLAVLVFDNASGDETEHVVRRLGEMDKRVRYFRHPENIGAFANFDFGLRRIETPFFSILSDDDVLLPWFFDDALGALTDHPEAAFCAGHAVCITEEGRIRNVTGVRSKYGYFSPEEGIVEILASPPTWTATLFRTRVLSSAGYLDPQVGPSSDLDFFLRNASRAPVVLCDQTFALFFLHEDNTSLSFSLADLYPAWLRLIENVTSIPTIPVSLRNEIEDTLTLRLSRRLHLLGRRAVLEGDLVLAREISQILRREFGCLAKSVQLELLSLLNSAAPGIMRLLVSLRRLGKRSVSPWVGEVQRYPDDVSDELLSTYLMSDHSRQGPSQ